MVISDFRKTLIRHRIILNIPTLFHHASIAWCSDRHGCFKFPFFELLPCFIKFRFFLNPERRAWGAGWIPFLYNLHWRDSTVVCRTAWVAFADCRALVFQHVNEDNPRFKAWKVLQCDAGRPFVMRQILQWFNQQMFPGWFPPKRHMRRNMEANSVKLCCYNDPWNIASTARLAINRFGGIIAMKYCSSENFCRSSY